MPKIVPKVSKRVLNVFWGEFFQKNCYPSVPWRLESSKIFKKIKKNSKFQKCPKSFPKVSKRVLNVFWGKFFEKFLTSFPWSVESSKHFKKNQKIFKNHTKNAPNRSKRIQKCFEHVFGQNFPKKIVIPVFHGGSSLRKFSKKIKKKFKIPKMPKIVPKSIQTCFERVLGQFFRKIFAQFSMEGRVFENFQKNQKKFKIPKRPKIVPKSIQTSSERVLRQFFSKKILPSFPWRVESSKIFKKKQRIFTVPKKPKMVTKSVQTCFELVLGQFFPKKNFIPVFHGGSSLRKFSKKIKKISKFQKCPKSFPKVFKRVLNKSWGKFFEKFLPSFPWSVESSKLFKKTKNFHSSKKAENRYQKCPNVF